MSPSLYVTTRNIFRSDSVPLFHFATIYVPWLLYRLPSILYFSHTSLSPIFFPASIWVLVGHMQLPALSRLVGSALFFRFLLILCLRAAIFLAILIYQSVRSSSSFFIIRAMFMILSITLHLKMRRYSAARLLLSLLSSRSRNRVKSHLTCAPWGGYNIAQEV